MSTLINKINVINLALVYLGVNTIADINENNPQAQSMKAVYDIELYSLLREAHWNFALRRKILNKVNETTDYGYTNVFALPSDYVRTVAVYLLGDLTTPLKQYKVIGNRIHSNQDKLYMEYVYFFDDTTKFDVSFIKALAYSLATSVSHSLTTMSNEKVALLEDKRKDALAYAITVNSQDNSIIHPQQGSWLEGR